MRRWTGRSSRPETRNSPAGCCGPQATRTRADEANAWGHYGYQKGTYIEDLTDEVIDAFTEHVPERNSPMSVAQLYRLDGAYSRVGDDDTAFSGGRSPRYGTFIIGQAPDADLLAADRDWSATSGGRCARTPSAAATATSTA